MFRIGVLKLVEEIRPIAGEVLRLILKLAVLYPVITKECAYFTSQVIITVVIASLLYY